MNKSNKLLLVLIIVAGIVMQGCIQSPEKYKEYTINATQTVINNQECTCMLCTNSTGSWFKDILVWNDLEYGSCFFKSNCSRGFLYHYLNDDKNNFVREFGIGQGASYTEFEEANLRCNTGMEYVVRVLYSKYRAPMFDVTTTSTSLEDTKEAAAIECSLRKGVIPIYVFYTEGTYVMDEWIPEFMKESEVEGPVFIVPEALFDENMVENVSRQINVIYSNCDVEKDEYCVEWKEDPSTTECGPTDMCYSSYTCARKEKVAERGCKVMLFPKQDSDQQMFELLGKFNESIMEKVSGVVIMAKVDKEHDCQAGPVLADAMNRSRYTLNKFGKPTFLILSVDPQCTNINEIAQTVYTSISVMRSVGIFGVAYSQYDNFEGNPLANKTNAYNIKNSNEWFKLCKYYNSEPYKKEPMVFQSDGVNISNVCEYISVHRMDFIDEAELNKFDGEKPDLSNKVKNDYEICMSEVDFGHIGKVVSGWENYDEETPKPTDSECTYDYPEVELTAERCGLSRHLIRALKKEGISVAKCSDWYDLEKELSDKGFIKIENINPARDYESELGIAAFMYVLKNTNEEYYRKIINGEPINGVKITRNNLYMLCNGIESSESKDSGNTNTKVSVKIDRPCNVLKIYESYYNNCNLEGLKESLLK
ncbi:MAG: hypothetical protein ACP5KJ_01930 [Candidatus Micrarchaeia archaeon]